MAGALSHVNVLVVDDNEQVRSIIGTVLKGAGVAEVHFAPDAARGMEALRSLSIDLAYVDYEMAGMNGLQFLREVRALDSEKRFLPIIMITGHSDMTRLSAARDGGVTEFLAKPITATTVLSRLNAVIMNPRCFVRAASYFGPDRRRRQGKDYKGPLRRVADKPNAIAI
jgi:CheY-like chemotaxis protein